MQLPPSHRPLVYKKPINEGQTIRLHAGHVKALKLRAIKPKEAFTIADQEGRFFRASLVSLHAQHGQALVYEEMSCSPESPIYITLFCAVLGRQRMLPVIQKATELGVVRIVPVLSEFSVPADGLAHQKAHSWPKQALRAARQCRRGSLPEVLPAISLVEAMRHRCFTEADVQIFLDDRRTGNLAGIAKAAGISIAFFVGPEGGWSEQECSSFISAGVHSLQIGGRVLRAETAVYAGLTILQHQYGDM